MIILVDSGLASGKGYLFYALNLVRFEPGREVGCDTVDIDAFKGDLLQEIDLAVLAGLDAFLVVSHSAGRANEVSILIQGRLFDSLSSRNSDEIIPLVELLGDGIAPRRNDCRGKSPFARVPGILVNSGKRASFHGGSEA